MNQPLAPQGTEAAAPAPQPHTERTHARVSSSKMYRLWHCLYSLHPGLELPPETTSEYAEEGTKYHEVIELRVNDFLKHRQSGSDPNASIKDILRNPLYTEDMLVMAERALETIWDKGLGNIITNKVWATEQRFTIMQDPEVSGVADFCAAYINDKGEKEGYIWDYKNGVQPVMARENKQLLFLAVGMQEMFGKKRPFDRIRTAIFQPNRQDGAPTYQEWGYRPKQLIAAKSRILKIAKNVYDPEKGKNGKLLGYTPKEGPGCMFCPALAVCPEKKKQLRALALTDKKDQITIPPVESLDDEFIARVLEHGDKIRDFLNAVYDAALLRAYTDDPLPGYKVVAGKSRRMWRKMEVDELISGLEAAGATNVWEKKVKTLTVIEKQLGKDGIEPFVTRTEPKDKLVPDSDKREAIDTKSNVRAVAGVSSTPAPAPDVIDVTPEPKTQKKSASKKKASSKKKTTAKRKRRTRRIKNQGE